MLLKEDKKNFTNGLYRAYFTGQELLDALNPCIYGIIMDFTDHQMEQPNLIKIALSVHE
jgi:hypothetical protein